MNRPHPNITVAEYGMWMIQTMSALPEGPEYEHLQNAFQAFCDQISHLERCYKL